MRTRPKAGAGSAGAGAGPAIPLEPAAATAAAAAAAVAAAAVPAAPLDRDAIAGGGGAHRAVRGRRVRTVTLPVPRGAHRLDTLLVVPPLTFDAHEAWRRGTAHAREEGARMSSSTARCTSRARISQKQRSGFQTTRLIRGKRTGGNQVSSCLSLVGPLSCAEDSLSGAKTMSRLQVSAAGPSANERITASGDMRMSKAAGREGESGRQVRKSADRQRGRK